MTGELPRQRYVGKDGELYQVTLDLENTPKLEKYHTYHNPTEVSTSKWERPSVLSLNLNFTSLRKEKIKQALSFKGKFSCTGEINKLKKGIVQESIA